MSILLLESLHTDAEVMLAAHGAVLLAETAEAALTAAQAGGVQAILTRGKGKITRELMAACGSSLKAVSRCGAGLDTVDVAAAQALGLTVIYAPGLNASPTAEHALMLMLAVGRKLATLNANVKAGNWAIRNSYEGVELRGKTLGIVGLGNIGRRAAELGQAFGMDVLFWNRSPPSSAVGRPSSLETVLRTSDFISLHVALNEETRGMIGAAQLAQMKPTAILINTARGALIDQQALAQALREGRLAGFGGDVLDGQPPDAHDPLLQQERAILTPHVAGLTDTTYRQVCVFCAQNVLAVVRGERPEAKAVYS